eukprot:541609-Pyramimonas_sp.AAC.1
MSSTWRIAPYRRRIGDASAMHPRRRRCIGDVGVDKTGLRIEPHRRCLGDAGQSPDPIYSDPIWEA